VLVIDLFDDLRDGFNLLTLLEVLSHQTFVRLAECDVVLSVCGVTLVALWRQTKHCNVSLFEKKTFSKKMKTEAIDHCRQH